MSLSKDQQEAINMITSRPGPFFLTGEAGTGKSFLVQHLKESQKGCVVTAMTGAAAQLVEGRTLHSFAGIHPQYGVVRSKRADHAIKKCKLLIIDEISMASTEVMEQLYERFNRAKAWPKVLMVGDFLQLPPVEGSVLFDNQDWENCQTIRLVTPHRQSDHNFLDILNDIRRGNLTERVRDFVASRRVDELPDDCSHLMARREPVRVRNVRKLEELPGQTRTSRMMVEYEKKKKKDDQTARYLSRSRFPHILHLKEKARVVLLTNEPTGRWVNGSTGQVAYIEHGTVGIDLDKGSLVEVSKEEESVLDGDGKRVCTICQYPILLAWAMTIHRAQGSTIDRVGVDLNGHFETGQTYVAISRCRTADGLFLVGNINRLMVDEKALAICG